MVVSGSFQYTAFVGGSQIKATAFTGAVVIDFFRNQSTGEKNVQKWIFFKVGVTSMVN